MPDRLKERSNLLRGQGQGSPIICSCERVHQRYCQEYRKSQRILDILACRATVHERIFMNCQNESQAYKVERTLIKAWKSGLTNIAMGNVSQEENIAAQIERDILRLRTFDEWVDASSDKYLQSVSKISGSPEAFYAICLDSIFRLLDKAIIAIAINTEPVAR